MRKRVVPNSLRLWVAIGLAFVVALFVAAPVTPSFAPVDHSDHHVSADGHLDHLAAVDHAHMDAAASLDAPDMAYDALAPRMRTALIAMGLVFALALLWRLSPQHTPAVGRDPPRAPVLASTGRDVLTRLCIARR